MKKYFIYAYGNTHTGFVYYELSSLDSNNGTPIMQMDLLFHTFKKKLWKDDFIGSIHEITDTDGKLSRVASASCVSYWKCKDDVAGWRVMQAAKDEYGKVLKEGKANQLKEALEPIRESYVQAGYNERRLILSEVIRIITTGG